MQHVLLLLPLCGARRRLGQCPARGGCRQRLGSAPRPAPRPAEMLPPGRAAAALAALALLAAAPGCSAQPRGPAPAFAEDVLRLFGGNRSLSAAQLAQLLQRLGAARPGGAPLPARLPLHHNQVPLPARPARLGATVAGKRPPGMGERVPKEVAAGGGLLEPRARLSPLLVPRGWESVPAPCTPTGRVLRLLRLV